MQKQLLNSIPLFPKFDLQLDRLEEQLQQRHCTKPLSRYQVDLFPLTQLSNQIS